MATTLETLEVKIIANLESLQVGLAQGSASFSKWANTNKAQIEAVAKSSAVIGTALTAASGLAIKGLIDMEKSMQGVRTQLAGMREGELKDFEKGLRDMSVNTGRDFATLAKGLEEVINAGIDTGKELGALNQINKLSTSTNAEFATSLETVRLATATFGKEAGTTEHIANTLFLTEKIGVVTSQDLASIFDRMASTAAGAGLKLESFSAAIAVMTNHGVSGRNIMASFNEILQLLTEKNVTAEAIMSRVGIAVGKTNLEAQNFIPTLAKLKNLTESEFNALIPNAKARESINVLIKNQGEFLATTNAFMTQNNALAEDFNKRQADLGTTLAKTSQAYKIMMAEAIQPLTPELIKLAAAFLHTAESIREFSLEHPTLGKGIGAVTLAIGPLLIALGGILALLPAWANGLKIVTEAMLGLNLALAASVIIYGALAIAIGVTIAKYLEMRDAEAKLKTAQEETPNRIQKEIDKIGDLLTSKEALTAQEREYLKAQYDSLVQNQAYLRAIQASGDGTRQEYEALANSTAEAIHNTEATIKLIEAKKNQKEATDSNAIAQTKESDAVVALSLRYLELSDELAKGTITKRVYSEEFVNLIQNFKDVGFSTEQVLLKLRELDKIDPNISVRLSIFGVEELDSLAERVKTLQQEIIVNSLEGDAKVAAQAAFSRQNAIDDIAKERDAVIAKNFAELEALHKVVEAKKKAAAEAKDTEKQKAEDDLALSQRAFDAKSQEFEFIAKNERELSAQLIAATELEFAQKLGLNEAEIKQLAQKTGANQLIQDILKKQLQAHKELTGEVTKTNDELTKSVQLQNTALDAARALVSLESGATRSPSGRTSSGALVSGLSFTNPPENFSGALVSKENSSTNLISQVTAGLSNIFAPVAKAVSNVASSVVAQTSGLETAWIRGINGVMQGVTVAPSGYAGYANGTPSVPKTGLALVHKGEAVIPADQNPFNGKGGQEVTIVNLFDEKMVPSIMARYPNAILNVVNEDIRRNGVTRQNIRRSM